jgi:predicted 2-oxoglutarate/Fe(II)-dependent dioxygenase YbiX
VRRYQLLDNELQQVASAEPANSSYAYLRVCTFHRALVYAENHFFEFHLPDVIRYEHPSVTISLGKYVDHSYWYERPYTITQRSPVRDDDMLVRYLDVLVE